MLSPDFRGHGQSAGDYTLRESQIDLKAAYGWLVDAGHSSIIMMVGSVSGTAATVLDATDTEVNFSAMAMIFSPHQDTGLDAQRNIGDLDTPAYFIGIDTGPSARTAKFI